MPLSRVLVLIFISSILFVFSFFYFSRNTAFKRKLWPVFIVTIFSGFILAPVLSMAITGKWRWGFLGVQILIFTLVGFLMIRRTRFCDSCGRTCYRQPIFSQPSFCSHCGAKLQ